MYNTAVGIIENLRTAGGNYSVSENSSVCVLVTASGRVYSGITGTIAENGKKNSCAEYNAIVSMMIDGERRISKMMTVMFKTGEVVLPCEECRDIVFKMDSENRNCEIAVSKSGTINLGVLMPASKNTPPPEPPVNDFNNSMDFGNFDFQEEEFQDNKNVFSEPKKFEVETADAKNNTDDFEFESPSSVDYVTEVKADEDNPFYEPEIKNQKSNIVRDGNIEFEMYDPNKKEEIPKPKALNQIPSSAFNSNSSENTNNYYNSKYDTGVSQYNSFSDSSYQKNEQYQSPYNYGKSTINSGTSSSSYYYSQMSSSNSSQGSAGSSIYKQKLDNLLGNSSNITESHESIPEQPQPEKSSKAISKLEMLKMAKEKKRLAKIDAKFQKKIKKKGY